MDKIKNHVKSHPQLYVSGLTLLMVAATCYVSQRDYKAYLQAHYSLALCAHDTVIHELLPQAIKEMK